MAKVHQFSFLITLRPEGKLHPIFGRDCGPPTQCNDKSNRFVQHSSSSAFTVSLTEPEETWLIISKVFPQIFSRYTPVLDGRTQVLERRRDFPKLLHRPSSLIAQPIKVLSETDSYAPVINSTARSRLGFVVVARKIGSSDILTAVELGDFIRMYNTGKLQKTNVNVENLTSSLILSVDGKDTLKHVIGVMLKHRKRMVLLRETKSLISDSDVLNFLIGSNRFEQLKDAPEKVLKTH
ncbi:MAG: hypothetical protein JRN20_04020 [Nitrososphaerota archaeon]|nr:hypothetical protein [Nitrososphaerota archaeon]